MTQIGDNFGAILTGFVDRFQHLCQEEEILKNDRKTYFEEMAQKDLPVAGIRAMIAQKEADQDKRATQRGVIEKAAALLNMPAYTGEVLPNATDADPEDIKLVNDRVEIILGINSDLKALGEDKKEVLKEAKAAGLVPNLIKECVRYRQNPDDYEANSILAASYISAIKGTKLPEQEDEE